MSTEETVATRKPRHGLETGPETGPFVLRSLLDGVPLSAEGGTHNIVINCVEFFDQNLYVGTSASEILHFVQIPPDSADPFGKPSYILASRLPPPYAETQATERPGVQQILLLPTLSKACVLCNGTVTFYSLPELSPVYGGRQVEKSSWIGGLDLNGGNLGGQDRRAAVTVLLSLSRKIRVVRVGEELRVPKSIDFAGSTITVRRDSFACVADSRSYALLDVDRQLKIPLFPISSLDESQANTVGGRVEDISGGGGSGTQQGSSLQGHPSLDDKGHNRSRSLGTLISGATRRQDSREPSGRDTPDNLFRETSPAPPISPARAAQGPASPRKRLSSPEKALPAPPVPATVTQQVPVPPTASVIYLKPHIVSPSPQEFLLLTGTGPTDPGVGIFVNLEGDVTRSTLEFERYPESVVADGRGIGTELSPTNAEAEEEGFILASIIRENKKYGKQSGIEIQRWDLDPGEVGTQKSWLQLPSLDTETSEEQTHVAPGLRSVTDAADISFDDVVEKMRLKRFRPFARKSLAASTLSMQSSDPRTATSLEMVSQEKKLFESFDNQSDEPEGWEERRDEEELQFAKRLGQTRSRIATWSGDQIWWTVRNPLILRVDAVLEIAGLDVSNGQSFEQVDRQRIIQTINSFRGREAKSEIEFMSLGYIRQRAGLLLIICNLASTDVSMDAYRSGEEALLESTLDPRVPLSLIPELRSEVFEGKTGIWVPGGVKEVADMYISAKDSEVDESKESSLPNHVLQFFRRFLTAWRRKKGFGSIANEGEVFRSVDAALLVVLLELDKSSPRGFPRPGSLRTELNDFVDHGVDCFDRAVVILESRHRLYVLSRLYQSKKMANEVLATWRRIIEGEFDAGGELNDGEQRVRAYLTIIGNQALVQEYGVWLAARNPKLGVQVFTEDDSKVKFEPSQVVEVLRRGAPEAVKHYLEHLVFGKNETKYVNELIAYYLDIVIQKLESSPEARAMLAQSYSTYRALRAPKPTYRQFITDNAIPDEWWHSRLRLLQLLGGSQTSASSYSVPTILARIEPFTQSLLPEVIILDGRQSRHQEALALLTHGLGDYDTAINYCLLGGSSIYNPLSGTLAREALPAREEQGRLFGFLLAEFLRIEDISDRVEQTGTLLERFGGWFDVDYVLRLIPDSWAVELVSGFLVSALRRIIKERNETMMAKALSGAENLRVNADLITKIDRIGPTIETQQ